MRSPEDLGPTKTKEVDAETVKVSEFLLETGDVEIGEGQFSQYAESAQTYVDQQNNLVLSEVEERIDPSAQGINMSADSFAEARQEYGLDAKLQEIKNEADEIAGDAKNEIAVAQEEGQQKENPEVKKQTPEELREERRKEIISEINREWEVVNGPMHRTLSPKEIADNARMAETLAFNDGKTGNRTTELTKDAADFYFDFDGMGKNSVPQRAERILLERYPEYAETVKAGKDQEKPKDKQQDNHSFETQISQPREEYWTAKELSDAFLKEGLKTRVVSVEDGGQFPEIIIFNKNERSPEKMVRIYRGINHMDASVLEQIPYAMRTESGTKTPKILEGVKLEIDNLANNPTYENLLAYYNKVRPSLLPHEADHLDVDLKKIEDRVLSGFSVRSEIKDRQTEHNGGWAEHGISPYISASLDMYVASGYGTGGLIVMDIPISQIAFLRTHSDEVGIKGVLDKRYVTAVLPRKFDPENKIKKSNIDLYKAMERLNEVAPVASVYGNELKKERDRLRSEETEIDKVQWKKDVEGVRQKRFSNLKKIFPEVNLVLRGTYEPDIDFFTKAKRDIFDFYELQLTALGMGLRNIEEYSYESEFGVTKRFDREKADEVMLIKFRMLVDHFKRIKARRDQI